MFGRLSVPLVALLMISAMPLAAAADPVDTVGGLVFDKVLGGDGGCPYWEWDAEKNQPRYQPCV